MAENTPHVQVKFFTKQLQYSVPDEPYSISTEFDRQKLSELINKLLDDDENLNVCDEIQFDFLLNGEILRTTLSKFLSDKDLSTETALEIEYLERQAAPRPEQTLEHDDWVSAVHGAGEHILSGSYSNTVHLWSVNGEKQEEAIMTIPGHAAPIKCVRWIKHEEADPVKSFVTGSHDQTALVWHWNVETTEVDCRLSCRGHAASVDCIAVNPSGTQMCTGSWDKMMKLWSTEYNPDCDEAAEDSDRPRKKKKSSSTPQTRVPLLTLSGHTEAVSAAAWMDDHTVVTSSWDHSIRLWDMQQARQSALLPGSKAFLSISFSSLNHTLLTGSADRHVRLYDPRNVDSMVVKSSFSSHSGWVTGVCWSPTREHLFISGSYDFVLKLWDTRSSKAPLYDMNKHEDRILAVDWSRADLILSGGADNSLNTFKYSAGLTESA